MLEVCVMACSRSIDTKLEICIALPSDAAFPARLVGEEPTRQSCNISKN